MLGLNGGGAAGAALLALLLTAILTPLVSRVARAFRASRPSSDNMGSHLPPRGGAAIGVAFVTASLLSPLAPAGNAILQASGLACLWGVVEDFRGLRLLPRLLVLTLAAAFLIRAGVVLTFLPGTAWGLRGEWALTALWVMGLALAFSALDRLDGLAAGTAAVNALLVGVHALTTGQRELGVLAAALLGATLGFLPYNFKARPREAVAAVALGPAGSLFLGVALAALLVLGEWAQTPGKDLLVPVLILAVPWLTFILMAQDAARAPEGPRRRLAVWVGGALYRVDKLDQLDGRPALGLAIRRKEAVALMWLASLCFGSSALLFRGSNPYDAFLILGQMVVVFGVIGYAIVIVRRRSGGGAPGDPGNLGRPGT